MGRTKLKPKMDLKPKWKSKTGLTPNVETKLKAKMGAGLKPKMETILMPKVQTQLRLKRLTIVRRQDCCFVGGGRASNERCQQLCLGCRCKNRPALPPYSTDASRN